MVTIELKNFSKEQIEELKTYLEPEIIKNYNQSNIWAFAKQLQSTLANNEIISQKKNLFSNKFNVENVKKYMESPQRYEKELRALSTILFTLSPQYKSIMTYLPSICRFYAVVNPNINKFSNSKGVPDIEKLRKEYLKSTEYLDKLNIKHEFQKIVSTCVREDVFYGYEMETNNSYFIRQLDSDYCKITSIEDGVFNFSFDFSYFDKFKELKGIELTVLDTFPEEFNSKYNAYLKDKKLQWQELDSSKTICIKFLEDLPFVFPAFASLYADIADLNDYKSLNMTKSEIDNYKFIGLKIPTLNKAEKADEFSIDVNTALSFYNMILEGLPNGVGAFLTPTEIEPINFGKSAVGSIDEVNRAEDNVYSSSGIAPVNFGKNANNAGAVSISNSIDQATMFKLYTQLERWLNRKFKREFNEKFSIELLRVGEFNVEKERDSLLKLGQFGVPIKTKLCALAGVSPYAERGLSILENEVLNLSENWKPLNSSYINPGDNSEGGAPEKDATELSDSGQVTRDNSSNANKV